MKMKIIAWSRRFIVVRARIEVHARRWYSALMPKRPRTATEYTAQAAAASADTVEAASATRVEPAAIPTANDHRCSQPRRRGLTGDASGGGTSARLTPPG